MNAIIIDDEPSAVEMLNRQIESHCPNLEIIGTAHNLKKASSLLSTEEVDLVFLDINLGDDSGFDLLRQYKSPKFYTIFITGYDQFAIEAFKFSAIDYLLKPIDSAELMEAVRKVSEEVKKDHVFFKMQSLLENLEMQQGNKKLVLGDNDSIHVLRLKDIIYCEADGSYSKFITGDRKEIFVSKNLKEYERLLKDVGFFRVHRSYLVNLQWIKKFDRSKGNLELENGDMVPVAQNKKESLFKRLSSFD